MVASLGSRRPADVLKILIVDDEAAVCTALRMLLEIHGLECTVARGPAEALEVVRRESVGVVIQDMNFTEDTTGGEEGKRLFAAIREADPDLPVLLMTAWTSVDTAVQMIKRGASDYIGKPWDDEKLVAGVRSLLRLRENCLATARLPSGTAARRDLAERYDLCDLIYSSERMHEIASLAVRIAAADVPVLITGPNGSGKEKIAEIIQVNSRRASKPFVKVNTGALPETLLETELFGSEPGAFTGATKLRVGRFEAADGGTIFLDEIGTLSPGGQIKLLRVLQTGEFERVGSSITRKADTRVISATNLDMTRAMAEGRFREDLYFRLNVIEVRVPPLRDRPEDILPLARHFLARHAAATDGTRPALELDEDAREALRAHAWPGNVRELDNCMQRAVLLCAGEQIRREHLRLDVSSVSSLPPAAASAAAPTVAGDPELARIEEALARADGVVARAAADLGLTRQALYRRMERLGLRIERTTRSDNRGDE